MKIVASLPRLHHRPKERKSREAGFQRHQRKKRCSEPGPARRVGSRPSLTAEAPPTKLTPPLPPRVPLPAPLPRPRYCPYKPYVYPTRNLLLGFSDWPAFLAQTQHPFT